MLARPVLPAGAGPCVPHRAPARRTHARSANPPFHLLPAAALPSIPAGAQAHLQLQLQLTIGAPLPVPAAARIAASCPQRNAALRATSLPRLPTRRRRRRRPQPPAAGRPLCSGVTRHVTAASSRLVLTPTGSGSCDHIGAKTTLPGPIPLKDGVYEVCAP